MRKGLIIGVLLGGCLAAVLGQSLGPEISAYYRMTPTQAPDLVKYPTSGGYPYQWQHLDYPFALAVDASGSPHWGITPTTYGPLGFIVQTDTDGNVRAVQLDTSQVIYAGTAPPAPGPCDALATAAGSGARPVDTAASATPRAYFCVPNAAGDGFVWMATPPLVTTWAP